MPLSPEVIQDLLVFGGGTLVTGATAVYVLAPLARAWARRIERGGGGGDPGELEELRERVAALEAREARLAEAEERLDFVERRLVREEPLRLPKGVDTPSEPAPAAR